MTDSEQALVETLHRLEDEGLELQYKTEQALLTSAGYDAIFNEYEKWKLGLLHLAQEMQNRDFELTIKKTDGVSTLLTGLLFGKHVPQGLPREYEVYENGEVHPGEEVTRQRNAMKLGIVERLNALAELRKQFVPTTSVVVSITYNTSLGQLKVASKTLEFEGVQKDICDCLVMNGFEVKVSWDEIHDDFVGEIASDTNAGKKKIYDAVLQVNKKTQSLLTENLEFIGYKNHEYWLQYKVSKSE
jgi:hypothetical protein